MVGAVAGGGGDSAGEPWRSRYQEHSFTQNAGKSDSRGSAGQLLVDFLRAAYLRHLQRGFSREHSGRAGDWGGAGLVNAARQVAVQAGLGRAGEVGVTGEREWDVWI